MRLAKPVLATAMAAGIALSPLAFAQKPPLSESNPAGIACQQLKNEEEVYRRKFAVAGGIFLTACGAVVVYSLRRPPTKKTPPPPCRMDAEERL